MSTTPTQNEHMQKSILDAVTTLAQRVDNQDKISIPSGFRGTIEQRPKGELGQFQAIGILRDSPFGPPDVFDVLEKTSKGAFKLFNQIKLHYDRKTGLARLPKPYETKGEQVVFSRYISELNRNDLVRKVKSRKTADGTEELVFMINPSFIKCFEFKRAKALWDSLPSKAP
ncbi:hypothetical protein GCM10009104_08700 [Marinobacterium maritimum]|uniref:Uncharacterized protein n=1 Tax=Marinobacterium maritimum TaxID=500162 RepID=A0ABN1I3A2_9GAMM